MHTYMKNYENYFLKLSSLILYAKIRNGVALHISYTYYIYIYIYIYIILLYIYNKIYLLK